MIGHQVARAYLEHTLPTATLLLGPASIGKWTLVGHLARHHQVQPVDQWESPNGLTIDAVRQIAAYAARAPQGPFKLVTARLDGSSKQALNALLKTLEEPPPQVKFLLVSTDRPLPTVVSRCIVFELGYLQPAELELIYLTRGYPGAKAKSAAAFARGQVSRGYRANNDAGKQMIVSLAQALALGDRDQFASVFASWDTHCAQTLVTFFTECLTHRWSTFAESESHGLHRDRTKLLAMITAIGRLPAARPRLGIRTALEPFLNSR